MAEPTKNPSFTVAAEIEREKTLRTQSIATIQQESNAQIRVRIQCSMSASIGGSTLSSPGERLHILPKYLISPEDRPKAEKLRNELSLITLSMSGGGMGRVPIIPPKSSIERMSQILKEMEPIYARGSDYVRRVVREAANWACVPPTMLAAVLQQENSPAASSWQRGLQAMERDLQSATNFISTWFGEGASTGFGNIKPATLKLAEGVFTKYYKQSVLRPGVPNVGQNQRIETDIYQAAAVLREGLNRAWSGGERSLNTDLTDRYGYYPYFGGTVDQDVATRAMGHYNGMGNDALSYGQTAMNRITREKLRFLGPG